MKIQFIRLALLAAILSLPFGLLGCEYNESPSSPPPPDDPPSSQLTRITWSATADSFVTGLGTTEIRVDNSRHRIDPYVRALRIEVELFGLGGTPIEKQTVEFPQIENSQDLDVTFREVTAGIRYSVVVVVFARENDTVDSAEVWNDGDPITVQT